MCREGETAGGALLRGANKAHPGGGVLVRDGQLLELAEGGVREPRRDGV